jgi:hypothetical protein
MPLLSRSDDESLRLSSIIRGYLFDELQAPANGASAFALVANILLSGALVGAVWTLAMAATKALG